MKKNESFFNKTSWYGLEDPGSYIFIKNLEPDAEITNIKSSNKKIIPLPIGTKVVSGDAFGGIFFQVDPDTCRSRTKSKITFKVKQNGKVYPLSCTVTVKKKNTTNYSKLSIGGKNYASSMKGYGQRILQLSGKKAKISVKMKPDTKLTNIYYYGANGRGKKIKNNTSVKLEKGGNIEVHYTYMEKPVNYDENGLSSPEALTGMDIIWIK